jgi:hypothetical protein
MSAKPRFRVWLVGDAADTLRMVSNPMVSLQRRAAGRGIRDGWKNWGIHGCLEKREKLWVVHARGLLEFLLRCVAGRGSRDGSASSAGAGAGAQGHWHALSRGGSHRPRRIPSTCELRPSSSLAPSFQNASAFCTHKLPCTHLFVCAWCFSCGRRAPTCYPHWIA